MLTPPHWQHDAAAARRWAIEARPSLEAQGVPTKVISAYQRVIEARDGDCVVVINGMAARGDNSCCHTNYIRLFRRAYRDSAIRGNEIR